MRSVAAAVTVRRADPPSLPEQMGVLLPPIEGGAGGGGGLSTRVARVFPGQGGQVAVLQGLTSRRRPASSWPSSAPAVAARAPCSGSWLA